MDFNCKCVWKLPERDRREREVAYFAQFSGESEELGGGIIAGRNLTLQEIVKLASAVTVDDAQWIVPDMKFWGKG